MKPEPVDPKYARRLTAVQAKALREARKVMTYREITEEFGISRQSAIAIVKGRTHRDQMREAAE